MTDNRFQKHLDKLAKRYSQLENVELFDRLENDGMVEQMSREWGRFKSVNNLAINANALWQKWIRR